MPAGAAAARGGAAHEAGSARPAPPSDGALLDGALADGALVDGPLSVVGAGDDVPPAAAAPVDGPTTGVGTPRWEPRRPTSRCPGPGCVGAPLSDAGAADGAPSTAVLWPWPRPGPLGAPASAGVVPAPPPRPPRRRLPRPSPGPCGPPPPCGPAGRVTGAVPALAALAALTLATALALTALAALALPVLARGAVRPRLAAHVHGAGQRVLVHEQLEAGLLLDGSGGSLGLGEVAQLPEAGAAAAGDVVRVGEQDGVGGAGRGPAHRRDGLAQQGEVADAGGAVRGHAGTLRPRPGDHVRGFVGTTSSPR